MGDEYYADDESPVSREELIGLGKTSIRKNYYAELQASLRELRRFRDLLDHSNDGIFVLAFPGLELVDWNQAAAVFLNDAKTGAGQESEDRRYAFMNALDDRDREALRRFCAESKTNDTHTLIAHFLRSVDCTLSVELTLRRVWYGNREFLVGTAKDITERETLVRQLRRSLREREEMLREIHHRVGNTFQLITSLLALQLQETRSDRDPGVRRNGKERDIPIDPVEYRLVQNTIDRVESMAAIHTDLYNTQQFDRIGMLSLTEDLLYRVAYARTSSAGDITFHVTGSPVTLNVSVAVPIMLVINELAINAVEHVFLKQGNLECSVEWERVHGGERLTFRDNGPGLPPAVNIANPKTLGLTLVTTLVKQARARLEYNGENGATFIVSL